MQTVAFSSPLASFALGAAIPTEREKKGKTPA